MELLKNVLIKEVGGKNANLGDTVFIVDNLPKSLLYGKEKKMVIDPNDAFQRLRPAYRVVDGERELTNEMVDALLPGIERSQTGDDAYVFFADMGEAKARLAAIKRYIEQTYPASDRIPQPIPYSSQPGVLSAGTRPISDLPRVVLPEPVSPPAQAVQVPAPTQISEPKKKQEWSEERKQAARENMAKARAIAAAKRAEQAQ